MIWRPKRNIPAAGDEKFVIKFAWIPVQLWDGRSLWLERYCQTYRCIRWDSMTWQGHRKKYYMWKSIRVNDLR